MRPYVVVRDDVFLRLDGPFAYEAWEPEPHRATMMTPARARVWAAIVGGRAKEMGGLRIEAPEVLTERPFLPIPRASSDQRPKASF